MHVILHINKKVKSYTHPVHITAHL